jgi:catalase
MVAGGEHCQLRAAIEVLVPYTTGYVIVPRTVSGPRVRVRAKSFSDHYSQATMFWKSMSEPEKDHIVAAFSFELGKCLS